MEQYARIISYLYRYKEGIKEENLGYAKIEKRGNACRIQAQIRGRNMPDSLLVYLFIQKETGIEGVFLGEAAARNGELIYKKAINAKDIVNSGKQIDEIDGMLLYESREHFFGTTWTKDRIELGNFMPETKKNEDVQVHESSDREKNEFTESKSTDKETFPSKSMLMEQEEQTTSTESILMEREEQQEEENIMETTEYNESEKEVWKEYSDIEETEEKWEDTSSEKYDEKEVVAQEKETECIPKMEEKKESPLTDQIWEQEQRRETTYGERILAHYPQMHPFGMAEADICVRLELQDIGCLPMEMWHLSGNRFMLHGYYCYRHLLFMEHEGNYFLGTPGIYNDAMRREANIFGFSKFRAMGNQSVRQGAFGYWLLELKGKIKEKTR